MTSPIEATCEACERRPASVAEPTEDPRAPYIVCRECHPRLLALALRPLEWFNLAKRHGVSSMMLHDDVYEDDGTARQPEAPVIDAEAFPAPTLDESDGNAALLLDYAVTRYWIKDTLAQRWRQLSPSDAVAALEDRFEGTLNQQIRSAVLELAGLTGPAAAALVRRAWQAWPTDIPWQALVQATAGCLPLDEGFALAEAALAAPQSPCRDAFGALASFRSARALRWIEANVRDPLGNSWGTLASQSEFDWRTAKAWLTGGRPLSLVAIDALLDIADRRTLIQQRLALTLAGTPDESEWRQVLEAALAADPVPRVRQRIGALMGNLAAQSNGVA